MDLKLLEETPPWDWPADADKILLEILAALKSGNPDIHYQAVCAAGKWENEFGDV